LVRVRQPGLEQAEYDASGLPSLASGWYNPPSVIARNRRERAIHGPGASQPVAKHT
jgi:hypothetical protein